MDWRAQAIDQLEWHWAGHVRPRLDGLTDDEYLWEPVPGCWSIRRRDEATSGMAAGAGDWVIDYEVPEPSPPPVTTIAWRLGHIAGVFGMRADAHFGDGSMTYFTVDWSPTAAGAMAFLDEQHDRWVDGIRALDDAAMDRPVGPAEGDWKDHPFGELILHINREVIHHSAEVLVLRDLYRARS